MWGEICTIVGSIVGAVLAIAGLNFVMFSWIRSDMKDYMNKLDAWRKDIDKETKDFHGKLCIIEERFKK